MQFSEGNVFPSDCKGPCDYINFPYVCIPLLGMQPCLSSNPFNVNYFPSGCDGTCDWVNSY